MIRLSTLACVALVAGLPAGVHGQWEVHTNVQTVRRLMADSSDVWAVTSGGLYRHADTGTSFEVFNSGHGLGCHDLYAADRVGDTFWVAGAGAVLTRFVPGSGGALRYPLQLGIGRVNALLSSGDTLWVGSDIGVGLFLKSVGNGLLKEVYTQLGTLPAESEVFDLAFYKDSIWVVTEFGIATANPDNPSLHIGTSWSTQADPTGALEAANRLEVFGDSLYVATDSGLLVWVDTLFEARATSGLAVRDLFAEPDTLWLATDGGAYFYTVDSLDQPPTNNVKPGDVSNIARVPGGNLWISFPRANLYQFGTFGPWFVETVINQPQGSAFTGLDQQNAVLFSAQRDRAASFLRTDGFWGLVPGPQPSAGAPTFVVTASAHEVYYPGFGAGLHRIDVVAGQLVATQFNALNSALAPVLGDTVYTVVADAAPDQAGGVWTANRFSANGQVLVYFGPGGTPQVTYGSAQGLTNTDMNVLLLTGNRLWIGYNGGGLGVLEFGGTPTNPGDDTYTLFSSQNDKLPSDVINALLEDRDHNVWVGTPGGLARLDLEFYPFLTVDNVSVSPADGEILSLAQDATGAIWVGTGGGLARIPNLQLVIDSTWFEGSSPLPSNRVHSLHADDWGPRIWIGTENGLAGRDYIAVTVTETPNVYPNPFEIRFSGDRATFEVPAGSMVDIFTVAGDRVRTLTEIYLWDGRNESGELVASGLYLYRVKFADGTFGKGRLGVVR
jgi:ligand-binding sensor domain-containing protein